MNLERFGNNMTFEELTKLTRVTQINVRALQYLVLLRSILI